MKLCWGYLMAGLLFLLLPLAYASDTPAVFSAHDLNADGYISVEEYKQFRKQYQQQRAREGKGHRYRWRAMNFVEFDVNGDQKISEDEMLDGLNRRFPRPCENRGRRWRGGAGSVKG